MPGGSKKVTHTETNLQFSACKVYISKGYKTFLQSHVTRRYQNSNLVFQLYVKTKNPAGLVPDLIC